MTSLSILFVVLSVVALTSVFILALPLHFKKQSKDSDDFTPVKLQSDFSRYINDGGAVRLQKLVTSENVTNTFKAVVHDGKAAVHGGKAAVHDGKAAVHHGDTKQSQTEFEDGALNLDTEETDGMVLTDSALHTRNEINISMERNYGHQYNKNEAGEPSEVIDIDNENDDVIHTTDDTDDLDMHV